MKYLLTILVMSSGFIYAQDLVQMPDIIYTHGNVWTVDRSRPQAQAFAIREGKFIAVGTDVEIKKLAGKKTREIDLHGKRVLPGLIDNHTHFISGGIYLLGFDLREVKNEKEFISRIAERAKKYPGKWILDGNWDHESWPGTRLPTKELIDPVTPGTPVFVDRLDGHMVLVNSLVLKLVGIDKNTPDPPGGMILKDPITGDPTGILKDQAKNLVLNIIPQPTREESLAGAEKALEEARKLGLTGIQDMSTWEEVRIFQDLKDRGKLTARIFSRIPIIQWDTSKIDIHIGEGDQWVRYGSLKAYADGSLGSSTALFFDPYVQDPGTRGLARDIVQDGRLERWALAADQAHLQICIHAIGDSANRFVLNLYEKMNRQNPSWDRRDRIEHAQHLSPDDITRFAKLDVIPSMQPAHCIDDGRWAEKRIGAERCRTTHAYRSLIDAGARLCFGSDWPVATLNPMVGIYSAVTRRTLDGKYPGGWFPEQKISVAEAVEAYTLNNAYASYEEHLKGTISPGKFADFVVLDQDIFSIPPEKIKTVTVIKTVVGGKVVFEK